MNNGEFIRKKVLELIILKDELEKLKKKKDPESREKIRRIRKKMISLLGEILSKG